MLCPFCCPETARVRLESPFALAFRDGFPPAEGRTLIIPKRHVAGLFELPDGEQVAGRALVARERDGGIRLEKWAAGCAWQIGRCGTQRERSKGGQSTSRASRSDDLLHDLRTR